MIQALPIFLLAAAVMAVGSYGAGRLHGGQRIQAKWDKERAVQTQQALEAERAARAIEQERQQAQKELINAANKQAAIARRDAAVAARAADGLRDAARAAAASCAPANPTATGASPADKLADVLLEMEREGRAVAEAADAAVIAGHACERAYMSLAQEARP